MTAVWEALSAIGTLLAVLVAVGVAVREGRRANRAERELRDDRARQEEERRRAVAAVVTAIVEERHDPSPDGTHYVRRDRLILTNASGEPVFGVVLGVARGEPPIALGPVFGPRSIPVLPAGSEREWDVSFAMLATQPLYGAIYEPISVELTFVDARGATWRRELDGSLNELGPDYTSPPYASVPDDVGHQQVRDLANPYNPMPIVLAFLTDLDHERTTAAIEPYLAPTAEGWRGITDAEVREIAEGLAEAGLPSHVWHPAPYVAIVRLLPGLGEADPADFVAAGGPMTHLTMVFIHSQGWRVFHLGPPIDPDSIPFPPGTLTSSPRGGPPVDAD
ncbi:hypothetical protein [Pseudactinotalea sp. Z1748]|uniref:hypothetical protein n=1 Tax=Pseudactinotalea sp. Z1748 TaxID=3413027 RepID=UPI003C7B2816